ncbi:MAG: hypothetical protein FGM30_05530 [Candidatus Fonsibacter sp.]|nr:hypothetical protein [Candidatus Fonsibacter sp.]
MYILISYDFLKSNDVSIHSITDNYDKAIKNYDDTIDRYYCYNEDDKHCKLIELIEIDNNFFDLEGFTFFWGLPHDKIKVIKSNNRDD